MLNPLDHPICLSCPERLCQSAWHEHAPFAMFLVDALKPTVLVELGTHFGYSYSSFCQAIKQLNLATRCYAVDTWEGDEHAGRDGSEGYGAHVLADFQGHHDQNYLGFSRLLRMNFDDAVNLFHDQTIDLLHIDGYHTYNEVRHDFENWLPKLRKGGIILFHDTNVREADFGVWRLWNELKERYKTFEFLHGHGLGVLAVGDEYPEILSDFFESQDETVARLRRLFAHLGQQVRLLYELRDTGARYAQAEHRAQVQEQRAADAIAQRDEREVAVANYSALLGERDHTIASLRRQLDERDAAVAKLNHQLGEHEQTSAARVQELQVVIDQKTQELQWVTNQIADHDRTVRLLSDQIFQRDQTIESFEARVADDDQQIKNLQHQITEQRLVQLWLDSEVARRDQEIEERVGDISDLQQIQHALTTHLEEIARSTPWRLGLAIQRIGLALAPPESYRGQTARLGLRGIKRIRRDGPIQATFQVFQALRRLLPQRVQGPRLALPAPAAHVQKHAATSERQEEPDPAAERDRHPPEAESTSVVPDPVAIQPCQPSTPLPSPSEPYQEWLRNNAWNEASAHEAQQVLEHLSRRPFFSVVLAVDEVDAAFLDETISSVWNQVYPDWELCVAVSDATPSTTKRLLRRLAVGEPRIKLRVPNGNDVPIHPAALAMSMATGEFLVLLGSGDYFEPNALLEIARAICDSQDRDIIYWDDDAVSKTGHRDDPRFKPGWSPELLLSTNYIGLSFAARRDWIEAVGIVRAGFEKVWEYDLLLRLADEADLTVTHLPKVLSHRRELAGSNRCAHPTEPEAHRQGVRAVQETLNRWGIAGQVARPDFAIREGLSITHIDFPDAGPKVSILIPTKNRHDLLRRCVDSIVAKTSYRNFEIVVIDNDSDDPETLEYLACLPQQCRVMSISSEGHPFSYARINNEAVDRLGYDCEFVVFLNNDTEVRQPEWLSQMVGYSAIPGVGAVGARLLFPDGRVQHAGVLPTAYDGMTAHAFKLAPWWDSGYLHQAVIARNVNAVTAACMLVRRSLFQQFGGFDESRYAVAFNDVDFCLRLREAHRRIVYVPRAELFHFEGATRGFGDDLREPLEFRRNWSSTDDPYWNPNLAIDHERFRISTRRTSSWIAPARLPLRVLFSCASLQPGTLAEHVRDVIIALRDRGRIAPEVVVPIEGALSHSFYAEGIPVHPLDRECEPLVDSIPGRSMDLIVAQSVADGWVVDAAESLGVPAIWRILEADDIGTAFDRTDPSWTNRALRALAYPYRVLFSSGAIRARFQSMNIRHNFDVHPLAWSRAATADRQVSLTREEAARRVGVPEGKLVVTVLGGGEDDAGVQDFVRAAFALLGGGRRDTVFFVLGSRTALEGDVVRELVLGNENDIRLVPATTEGKSYALASDIVVCGSSVANAEGLTLKAMAFERPVLSPSFLGAEELYRGDPSDWTFEPGDVSTLARHLQRLLQHAEERQELVRRGLLCLDLRPTFDETIEGLERFCLEACAAASGASSQGGLPTHRGVA